MRKQLLLLASFFLSVLAMAQTKPSFGVRAGVTYAGMQGEAVNNLQNLLDYTKGGISTSSRLGVFAGAHVTLPLSAGLSLEPGLYYAQKGYELNGELNLKGLEFIGARAQAQLKTHYVDMPLLLKANLNGLQLFAGPQISYLAAADLRTTAGVLGINLLNKTTDATAQFNRWDAGLTGGVGYQFKNGVNIGAAYDHGLSRTDARKSLNAYTRSVKISLGYNF